LNDTRRQQQKNPPIERVFGTILNFFRLSISGGGGNRTRQCGMQLLENPGNMSFLSSRTLQNLYYSGIILLTLLLTLENLDFA